MAARHRRLERAGRLARVPRAIKIWEGSVGNLARQEQLASLAALPGDPEKLVIQAELDDEQLEHLLQEDHPIKDFDELSCDELRRLICEEFDAGDDL